MLAVPLHLVRTTVRHFSARRSKPNTRISRMVSMSCVVSAVVLPFIPPALESSREKNLGYPNHNKYVLSCLNDGSLYSQGPSPTVFPCPLIPGHRLYCGTA